MIYFTRDFYESKNNLNSTRTDDFSKSYYRTKASIKYNNMIKFIRTTLDNEYNQDDLLAFYQTVEKEFSLGLRCARKSNKPTKTAISTTTSSNSTMSYSSNRTNTTSTTTESSTSTTSQLLTSRSRKVSVPRYRRTTLYSFILNNSDACHNEAVDLLIMIISKSDNYKTRDAIRRTWGSGKNLGNLSEIQIRFFFLIDFDEKLSSNIRLENDLFHDIIQVELPQQYTLVTHRVLSLVEWSFRFCRTAKFLFKTDDDIFINLILLLKFVSPYLDRPWNNSFQISEMTIYGYKHYNPGVFRQANDAVGNRYVVTIDEFPCGRYPDFLSGFGYLISKKARDALMYAAQSDLDPPFRISDVYVTGILPDYLSIPRQPMSDYTIRYQGNCDNFFDNPKAFACAAGLHHGDTSDVFAKFNGYWQRVRQHL